MVRLVTWRIGTLRGLGWEICDKVCKRAVHLPYLEDTRLRCGDGIIGVEDVLVVVVRKSSWLWWGMCVSE